MAATLGGVTAEGVAALGVGLVVGDDLPCGAAAVLRGCVSGCFAGGLAVGLAAGRAVLAEGGGWVGFGSGLRSG